MSTPLVQQNFFQSSVSASLSHRSWMNLQAQISDKQISLCNSGSRLTQNYSRDMFPFRVDISLYPSAYGIEHSTSRMTNETWELKFR